MKFPSPSSAEAVVAVTDLTRRFGSKTAVNNVSLYVPPGCVFGLVGENGAGKTTLIKHLLGLLAAQTGQVRVFGLDPVAEPKAVLSRIGYLSEQPDLPGWMRVDELLRYTQAFYPQWDMTYAERLREEFGLDRTQRIKTLSKGQLTKAALLTAQAHRPDLLLLDEPSSGLDPLVRRDILEAVIRTVADEGRTVFFSSHLLEEIERVSDQIAMLHQGKLVMCGPLDEVKAQHHRVTLHFDTAQSRPPVVPGALSVTGLAKEWVVLCNSGWGQLPAAAERLGARIVEEQAPSLNEIFIAYAGMTAAEPPTQPQPTIVE
jgi:ABC-2 type transport system ATP-binding protein